MSPLICITVQAAEWVISSVGGPKTLASDIKIQLQLADTKKYLCSNERKEISVVSSDELPHSNNGILTVDDVINLL